MKQLIFKSLVCVALSATLFSFSRIGGDSYTIHLNDKQIIQHYVYAKTALPSFSLNAASPTDQLSVYYSECGKVGKGRKLSVLDEKDNKLAEWSFVNATDEHNPMFVKAKDILAFKQKNNKVKLVYTSNEVSNGRVLATVQLGDEVKARK